MRHHINRKLEEIRARPHHERQAIAAGVSIAITAVIFVGWGYNFLNKIGALKEVPQYTVDTKEEMQDATALMRAAFESSGPQEGAGADGYVDLQTAAAAGYTY
jgi:hypothetical protein